MTPFDPPRLPAWLTGLVPQRHRDEWVGDLVERWHDERRSGVGAWSAGCRLRVRLVRSVAAAWVVERRLDRGSNEGGGAMGFGLWQDVRLAVRTLRREPAAAGAAFGTLALGVWAFLVGFALVQGALLDRLGYPEEDRLAVVGLGEGALFGIAMPDHVELVEESDLFEAASVWQGWGVLLRPEDGPWRQVAAASVSSSYFRMLGAQPALGRLFGPADDVGGHDPVVVLSHDAWVADYGARPDVLGAPIEHEGVSYTVVGVVEEGFRDPLPRLFGWSPPQLWRVSPPVFATSRDARGQVSFWSLARVREGVPISEASAAVRARRAERLGVTASEVDIAARPYGALLERESRGSLVLLLGAGVLVLFVSGANLVNLLLARGTGRAQEMAVRSALGAGRGRLVRQLLVEGGVLGVAAATVGAALTRVTLAPVVRAAAELLPTEVQIDVDGPVVLTAVAVSIAAAVGAALLPAMGATRPVRMAGLRQGSRGARVRSPLQTALIVTQTALAVVLLSGAGLLLRTVRALAAEDVGFDAASVVATPVSLHAELFGDAAEQTATLHALLQRFGRLPGVTAAGAITDLPMSGRVNSTSIARPDQVEGAPLRSLQTLVRAVEGDYFDVLGIPLLRGRAFGESDRPRAPDVALVNRTYAERHFPDVDPIGRSVVVRGVERRIVGVIEDVTEFSVGGGATPVLYEPFAQAGQAWMRTTMFVVLRADGAPPSLDALRAAGEDVDARVPVGRAFPLSAFVDDDTAGHRFRALLATSLGLLAMALASVGLAGVTAYVVRRRTRELGVRVALGAGPRRIALTVLRGSGGLTALGILLGLVLSVPAGRVLSGFLYEVPALDPLSLVAAALVLAASSLVAAAVPARRAVRIAPVDALREE